MAERGVVAKVNPQMLIWARSVLRMPVEIAAQKIGILPEKLMSFEAGESHPSFSQFLRIGKAYRKNPAIFFFDETPHEVSPPPDFRTVDSSPAALSVESLIEFHRVIAKRENTLELKGLLDETVGKFRSGISLKDNPVELARRWRKTFGLDNFLPGDWKSEYEAFNFWRSAIEAQGVLVFQISGKTVEEFRGATLFYPVLPIIILNSKDTVRGRIFSMLHEFCHVLLNMSGVGDMTSSINSRNINPVEVFCNAFAGACLVPEENIFNHPIVRKEGKSIRDIATIKILISRISNGYQVSKEVAIRRLLDLSIINRSAYENVVEDLRDGFKANKKAEGFVDWITRQYSSNGPSYTALVFRAGDAGKITQSDVSTILGVKINHLQNLKQKLGKNQE